MPPSRAPAAESSTELGSFRDPDSRVFLDDDVVYRVLSRDGWQDWLAAGRDRRSSPTSG